jgi:periplasmic protein TonB
MMKQVNQSFSGWSFDDIIFEGRNKAYGAYMLRKEQPQNQLIGLAATLVLCILPFALHWIDFSIPPSIIPKTEIIARPTIIDIPYITQPIHVPPPQVQHIAPQPATAHQYPIIAIKDKLVPTTQQIPKLDVGIDKPLSPPHNGSPSGEIMIPNGSSTPLPLEIETHTTFTTVEQMPEYPGGEAALFSFIQRNIQYPAMERDNDIQGKVFVGFVVMEDGSISDVNVKKGVSPGLDKEAVRVVRLLPKFKPGRQQGKNVKVFYSIPIAYKLAQ